MLFVRHFQLEAQLYSSVRGAPKIWKAKDLRVMLIHQIVDSTEERKVRIHFVFGCEVNEAVILNVEIRSTEIDFFARVHELRFHCGAQLLPPKIRRRNVKLIAWPARQTRALRLRNIG